MHKVSQIVQSVSGCLEPATISKRTTDGLVTTFGHAFARIWLMEPDRTHLRLVASSGLYTHTDGSFARVPVGAFKVGKIAQNRIPFLSNRLADEPWVKDRQWAIKHGITGFAGYPLLTTEQVIGVIAVFSYQPLSPEFLEVLRGLCMTVTLALDNARRYQQERQIWQAMTPAAVPLSEQIAGLLHHTRLMLVGTERSLPASLNCPLLRMAEILQTVTCTSCRLSYGEEEVALEAMVSLPDALPPNWMVSMFGDLLMSATCLGGALQTISGANQQVMQVILQLPYAQISLGAALRIHLSSPVLQTAMTHLAYLAKLHVCTTCEATVPLLTNDLDQAATSDRVLWLSDRIQSPPKHALGKIDLSIRPAQLREAVEATAQGKAWGMPESSVSGTPSLSDRELEIMQLLTEGLRDRDIANQLYISERTVKFHINNILTKLRAKTRSQAAYVYSRALVES